MHAMMSIVYDNKLHLAPIGLTPQSILDLGTGSGIWCIEMGDLYPSAEVTGVDLSANMPNWVPPNVSFEVSVNLLLASTCLCRLTIRQVEDIEEPWTFSRPFDYIHARYLANAIRDWPNLVHQCFE
jgi:cyclopropane fatty-acyl-phospholipid synthase-like methyltransferase